ncbi:hypothetical protein F5Y08DRAFT_29589 [Xylaria arbuscula]|nr:hypothetical protein F5Y08DRAFT_29589 [Xylaria arbuscula]
MTAITRRQKACIPCAESKRRCDKEVPECRRCIEKDLDCVYPQPKKRRRDLGTTHGTQGVPDIVSSSTSGQEQGDLILSEYDNSNYNADIDVLGVGQFRSEPWGSAAIENLDEGFLDEGLRLNMPASTVPAPDPFLEQGLAIDTNKPSIPFFLRDETLAMHHKEHPTDCVNTVEMEPFVGEVEKMLQSWTTHGSCGFIHRRLYDKGMPTCVQDAFTTFAAYAHRTPATKETILQIADDRASALAEHAVNPAVRGIQEIWAHLARVHSLFVYVFIRLFDGSVRMRASAETQIPTLRAWVGQMWQAVQRHSWDDYASVRDRRPLLLGASGGDFHTEYDATTETWQLWILTESVRRTYLIIDVALNTFQLMRSGWADCEGYVVCTVRRGLWDADSAVKWLKLARAADVKSPLMIPALTPQPVIAQHPSRDFDDFAKLCWSFIVGTDKIQSWVEECSA